MNNWCLYTVNVSKLIINGQKHIPRQQLLILQIQHKRKTFHNYNRLDKITSYTTQIFRCIYQLGTYW